MDANEPRLAAILTGLSAPGTNSDAPGRVESRMVAPRRARVDLIRAHLGATTEAVDMAPEVGRPALPQTVAVRWAQTTHHAPSGRRYARSPRGGTRRAAANERLGPSSFVALVRGSSSTPRRARQNAPPRRLRGRSGVGGLGRGEADGQVEGRTEKGTGAVLVL